MPSDAIPADSASFPALVPVANELAVNEPVVRRMAGLPRALVWTVLILAPWVAIVQLARLVF